MSNQADTTEPEVESAPGDNPSGRGEDAEPPLLRQTAADDAPTPGDEPSETAGAEATADGTDEPDTGAATSVDHPHSAPDVDRPRDDDGRPPKETILEMRQVAGLTAGSVMGLHVGTFQFRESEKEVGFSVRVADRDEVTVTAGAVEAMIDETPVTGQHPIGAAVLNVGSACFTVRGPRTVPTTDELVAELEASTTPPSPITVPDLEEPAAVEPAKPRRRRSKDAEGQPPALGEDASVFLDTIRQARSTVAERHRRLHPDPEELRSRLERLGPGLWDRSVEHPLFARFAVAYATIPWEPRFDDPDRIPIALHQPIQELSCLPWVPITANLLYGPLGIVGARSAVMACARHAILSLAGLTAPTDIEFSIVTAQGLIEDWAWTSSLPNSLFPNGRDAYCIAVADGMSHFEGAGFDHETVKNNEMGLIVLAETIDELPDYCATTLELIDGGRCRVTNHLGEQIVGTPIGVATDFAAETASLVKDAIGDGDDEDWPEGGDDDHPPALEGADGGSVDLRPPEGEQDTTSSDTATTTDGDDAEDGQDQRSPATKER